MLNKVKIIILSIIGLAILSLLGLGLIGYYAPEKLTEKEVLVQPGVYKFERLEFLPEAKRENEVLIEVTQSGFTPEELKIKPGQIINFHNLTGVIIVLEPGYLQKPLVLEPQTVMSAKFEQTTELTIKNTNKKIIIIVE